MGDSPVSRAAWRKSSRSGQNGNCVEVADLVTSIGLRDSKAPEAGHLSLPRSAWAAFVAEVRNGHHVRV